MTRINVVPVEELSDGHLRVEHYELPRVFVLVQKAVHRGEQWPHHRLDEYRMGEGHVRFFYTRLLWLKRREAQLIVEMLRRGLPLERAEWDTSGIPPSWFGDYEPTAEALRINRERLALRTMEYERLRTRGYFQ